jgi:5-methylcytosine-specific restriction endonuclease McrA
MATGRELRDVTCRGCGVIFQSHSRSVVYCCSTCSWVSPYLRYREPRCLVCGGRIEPFNPVTGAHVTREEYWQQQGAFESEHRSCVRTMLDRYVGEARLACRCKACRMERGELLPTAPASGGTRTSRTREVSSAYLKNRMLVLERDGWTCQICGLPLDPDASVIDDLYPQVDHVWPVAYGGGDEVSNLRASHRWCNWALSADGVVAEVREAAHIRYAVRNAMPPTP